MGLTTTTQCHQVFVGPALLRCHDGPAAYEPYETRQVACGHGFGLGAELPRGVFRDK
jgi:hypothetical protein